MQALCAALGVSREAFNQAPAEKPPAKRGRPKKSPAATKVEPQQEKTPKRREPTEQLPGPSPAIAALYKQVFPFLGELEYWGRQSQYQQSPSEMKRLGGELGGVFDTAAKESSTDTQIIALYKKAKPLIDVIDYWGQQHQSHMAPHEIRNIGIKLHRLFVSKEEEQRKRKRMGKRKGTK